MKNDLRKQGELWISLNSNGTYLLHLGLPVWQEPSLYNSRYFWLTTWAIKFGIFSVTFKNNPFNLKEGEYRKAYITDKKFGEKDSIAFKIPSTARRSDNSFEIEFAKDSRVIESYFICTPKNISDFDRFGLGYLSTEKNYYLTVRKT